MFVYEAEKSQQLCQPRNNQDPSHVTCRNSQHTATASARRMKARDVCWAPGCSSLLQGGYFGQRMGRELDKRRSRCLFARAQYARRAAGSVASTQASPDSYDVPFLPQTIEYALNQAQMATASALQQGHTRLAVALPMGRSRKHWYRLSPPSSELVQAESAILTLHFAELFKGANICVVLGYDSRPPYTISWIQDLRLLGDAARVASNVDRFHILTDNNLVGETDAVTEQQPKVLIVGAVCAAQKPQLDVLLKKVDPDIAIVAVNCLLDLPAAPSPFPACFEYVYVCRCRNKAAYLFIGYGPLACSWQIFSEISVFEFEWVAQRDADWEPTDVALDDVLREVGVRRRGINGYWESCAPGRESGFWPFMSIACPNVMPLPGWMFEQKIKKKNNSSKKPFGFF